jgi:peroxiredoxin
LRFIATLALLAPAAAAAGYNPARPGAFEPPCFIIAETPSDTSADQSPQDDSPRVRGANVTQVDLMRAAHIEDLPQRLELLESFLQRPRREDMRPLLFRLIVSTCREMGDVEAATFYGEEALAANPSDGPILLDLTAAYAADDSSDVDRGIGYAERAMDALNAAAKAIGEGGEARVSVFVGYLLRDWGWLVFRRGEVEEAERMLVEATDRRKDPTTYLRLGLVHKSMGKRDVAKDDFAMALALSSGRDLEALDAIQEIVTAEGGGTADVDAIVEEKRSEIARMKKEQMAAQSRVKPEPAPDFTVVTTGGTEFALADLRGSVVVLDFWATWCGPCRRELPMVQKTHEGFQGKNVSFLGISIDADTSLVRPFLEKHKLTLPVAASREVGQDYGASSIPMLVVIDGEGRLRYVHTGYHPDLEQVLPEEINELLEEL